MGPVACLNSDNTMKINIKNLQMNKNEKDEKIEDR